MLVENEIDIRTMRWLVLDAAARADRGESFRTESAIAKLQCSELSFKVVDRCMQIHGGWVSPRITPRTMVQRDAHTTNR